MTQTKICSPEHCRNPKTTVTSYSRQHLTEINESSPETLGDRIKVIDMSCRLPSEEPGAYDKWYGWTHTNQSCLKKAAYGLPELHREEIRKHDL